ncbi:MAG TPA: nicotinate phosphoribosyltransferase [bacterium]
MTRELPPLSSIEDVRRYVVDSKNRLHSASHREILAGLTTDIYFVRTLEILRSLGLADIPVAAEIFPGRDGICAGVEEVRYLLRDSGAKIQSLAEGERFSAREVVMRIEGPYARFGMFETVLLGMLAQPSGWATAAREVVAAAGEKPAYVFGARHVHPAVAPVMERSALIGGMRGAACILGAKLAGQEPVGTMPHAFILIVGDTVRAAIAYHERMPAGVPRLVLVDTFTDEAVEALRVAEALGPKLDAIRLDTPRERGSVTPDLVREVRARLTLAGHGNVQIFVSGGLTLERIQALSEAGADAFGVGSYVSAAPPIDMTMDLREISGRPIAKRGRTPGRTPTTRLRS